MKTKTILVLAVLVSSFLLPTFSFSQGSLTPPGAPAPTFKTLQQIEPRVDLQNAPAAAVDTGNANYHFIINQPGSYYLSANVDVTKTNGVQINAEGVTLDLNGFTISRTSGSGGDGVQISAGAHRFSLRNGSIKGFAFGINSINPSYGARGVELRYLNVSGCTSTAILSGAGASLESCRVHNNTGNYGFSCSLGSTLTNCTASANTVTYAIATGVGANLLHCTASSNTCSFGIYADVGSVISNCVAVANVGTDSFSCGFMTATGCTITASTAQSNYTNAGTRTPNTGMGFWVGSGSAIQGCTAAANWGDGMQLYSSTMARGNNCTFNGSNGDGAGIHVTSSGNRVEGNNVVSNDRGIDVDATGNVIVQNTATQNTINYDIAANNVFGAIVDRTTPASGAVSGNSAPASAGTTDPWANISY